MPKQITWTFVETSLFPLVVTDARRAGINTDGWAIDRREGWARMFCRLTADGAVETVYHRFASAKDADRFFQGVRWALSRMPNGNA